MYLLVIHTKTIEMAYPIRKKSYIDLAGVLILISTFAGSFTLTIYFTISCHESRAAALLLWASLILLTIPLVSLVIFSLLFFYNDDDTIPGSLQTAVGAQFAFVISLLTLALFLIAFAFLFDSKQKVLPIGGIIAIGIILSFSISRSFLLPVFFRSQLPQCRVQRMKAQEVVGMSVLEIFGDRLNRQTTVYKVVSMGLLNFGDQLKRHSDYGRFWQTRIPVRWHW